MSTTNPTVLSQLQKAREPRGKAAERKKAQEKDSKVLAAADKEFYIEVWAASRHVCQECGCKLGKEPLTLYFHHLLPKSKYPKFRHTPENIMILCADCHVQAETDIDKVPKAKARTQEAVKLLLN